MRVLIFEPGYTPYEGFFKNGEDAKKIIHGESQMLFPFENEVVALVCEKDQSLGKPNRAIDETTIVNGRFFLCAWDGSAMQSLSRKRADRYTRRYLFTERFEPTAEGVNVLPAEPRIKPTDERLGRKKHWFLER